MAPSASLAFAFLLAHAAEAELPPYWPTKNGNSNRTGHAEHTAPFDLSHPTWVWQEPDRPRIRTLEAFHSSPVVDAGKMTYMSSTTGRIYKLDVHGRLLWNYTSTGYNTGNVALHDGTLVSAADDGFAFAIEASTGRELWRARIGAGAPSDTFSPLVAQGLVILPACSNASDTDGNDRIVALSVEDGRERWNYTMPSGLRGLNFMPAEFNDSVVFPDRAGGLYRLLLANGSEVWRVPPPGGNEHSITTGGLAFGPNSTAYVGSGTQGLSILSGLGLLNAYKLEDGTRLWKQNVNASINAAPAVGRVVGHDSVAVIVAIGANPLTPGVPGLEVAGHVEALDARTGKLLWTFHPGVLRSSGCAGFREYDVCYPDLFGNPSIGKDGTVYLNWSGGWAFALRDANGDGEVDRSDPAEVSAFFHDGGTNGQSAIAPGLVVAPSCWKVFGFVGSAPPVEPPFVSRDLMGLAAVSVVVLISVAVIVFYCSVHFRRQGQMTEAEETLREASLQPTAH